MESARGISSAKNRKTAADHADYFIHVQSDSPPGNPRAPVFSSIHKTRRRRRRHLDTSLLRPVKVPPRVYCIVVVFDIAKLSTLI